ncbi:MAG: TraB/GumN family protein [Desulfobacterales bacterium]|nr:TraB/GumN family protein [Desulfobacterales bacterium]
MNPPELHTILENASIPEHSAQFMSAMSGGEPFLEGPYLFIAAEDWLLAVGYPLDGEYRAEEFGAALSRALQRTRARDCWAISPDLPGNLKPHCCDRDRYYILNADATVSPRLDRLSQRAAALLQVEEGAVFTPAHRRLWAEFVGRKGLPPTVRELFARTETVLKYAPGLSLLNAWDGDGNLAASLLLDSAPHRFCSYLIGAHSRTHHTPYASDLLFREMIRRAAESGKTYLHLGLGVNAGIRRFKTKWGAAPGPAYEMAQWQENGTERAGAGLLMDMLAALPREPVSKEQFMASLPKQRRFNMLWEIEKNGRTSWIGGTAHFFCYSFEFSLRKLFEKVDTVLFEGPLDSTSLEQVSETGRHPDPESPRLMDALTEAEVRSLERVVCGPRGFWAALIGTRMPDPPDVSYFLSRTRHWTAFFSLWSEFLKRQGWTQSVDLEAWHLGHDMGKSVVAMETIPEQIQTLESISIERIVNFFRQSHLWQGYIKRYVRAYLKGDVDNLYGTSAEFPTRSEFVIHRRDAVFLERMGPHLEEGRCAVFVGSAHMINLRRMLVEAGFMVRRGR